jgi:hypothetical protein
MADVQVTLRLPVLKTGSMPETGPTVVKHLQLMLNQRGGFPILIEDGDFGSRSVGQALSAEREPYRRRDRRKTDMDVPAV